MTPQERKGIYLEVAKEALKAGDGFFLCNRLVGYIDNRFGLFTQFPEFWLFIPDSQYAYFNFGTLHRARLNGKEISSEEANNRRCFAMLFCAEMTQTK